MMARNGRSGCSRALAKYVNSFFRRNPEARCGSWQPTIELQHSIDSASSIDDDNIAIMEHWEQYN